jgi:GNAT superfamily N-acetyltransferase
LTLIHDQAAVAARRVGAARPADASRLAAALAAAFYVDPVFRWLAPDDHRRSAILPAYFGAVIEAYLTHGETYADNELVGAALWATPGIDPIAADPVYVPRLHEIAGPDAPRLFEIIERFEAQAPRKPHYHLQFLGVRPERQGAGLGAALMKPVLDRCDRDGVPAYVEATSDRNRALYERHRFRATAGIPLPGDGPTVWCMWRDPAR